eukprot:COSAG04_NODE_194_length_20815_cov_4.321591_14_plen_343_part_00
MADGLVAMGFSPEQAEAAFAATGDVERALAILLEQAEGADGGAPAAAPEDAAPLDVLADAKLELLVEMGYAPLVAAKALVLHRGDAERASAFLLEQPSPLDESLFVLTPEELGPALRGGETRGLRVQLQAICQAPGPFMRSAVGAALLDFLRSRAAGAEREESWRTTAAWACRVLNAVADGSQLLQLPTVELLLECLAPTQLGAGDSAAAERLSASGSLSDVLASMLRRIELESAEQRELRQACSPRCCSSSRASRPLTRARRCRRPARPRSSWQGRSPRTTSSGTCGRRRRWSRRCAPSCATGTRAATPRSAGWTSCTGWSARTPAALPLRRAPPPSSSPC